MCYEVLIYTTDDAINFKIYIRSCSKVMADREKKKGRPKYKNLNISGTKKAFDNYLRVIIW